MQNGVARTLDPKLDMWAVADPVVEVGPGWSGLPAVRRALRSWSY